MNFFARTFSTSTTIALLTLSFVLIAGCGGPSTVCQDEIEAARKARAEKDRKEKLEMAERAKKQREAKVLAVAEKKRKLEEAKAEQERLRRQAAMNRPNLSSREAEELLPKDYADWTREDYSLARRSDNTRLAKALIALSKKENEAPTSDSSSGISAALTNLIPSGKNNKFATIPLIADLLAEEASDMGGEVDMSPSTLLATYQTSRVPIKRDCQWIQTATDIVLYDGSPAAMTLFEKIALGKCGDSIASQTHHAAIKSMLHLPSKETESLLIRCLTEVPESVKRQAIEQSGQESQVRRATTRDNDKWADLPEEILDSLRFDSTAETRLKIAQALANADPRRTEILTGCLTEPQVKNLGAQVVLIMNLNTPEETVKEIQKIALIHALAAWTMYLQPDDGRTIASFDENPSSSGKSKNRKTPLPRELYNLLTQDPETPKRTALYLWSRAPMQAIYDRLHHLTTLDSNPESVLLAMTIPDMTIRAKLVETLQRNWTDGPESLTDLGLTEELLVDPGSVIVLKKALPKLTLDEMTPAQRFAFTHGDRNSSGGVFGAYRTGSTTASYGSNRFSGGGRTRSSSNLYGSHTSQTRLYNNAGMNKFDLEMQISRTGCHRRWVMTILKLSLYFCEQYAKISHSIVDAPTDTEGFFPVRLHNNARVIARYEYPANGTMLPSSMTGKTRADYIKIEERNTPERLIGFYQRELPRASVFHFTDGIWMTSLFEDEDTRTLKSVDLFIQKFETYAPIDKEQKVGLQILITEIPRI